VASVHGTKKRRFLRPCSRTNPNFNGPNGQRFSAPYPGMAATGSAGPEPGGADRDRSGPAPRNGIFVIGPGVPRGQYGHPGSPGPAGGGTGLPLRWPPGAGGVGGGQPVPSGFTPASPPGGWCSFVFFFCFFGFVFCFPLPSSLLPVTVAPGEPPVGLLLPHGTRRTAFQHHGRRPRTPTASKARPLLDGVPGPRSRLTTKRRAARCAPGRTRAGLEKPRG